MIEFFATVAFLALAVSAVLLALRAKERLAALEGAWPHRQRLAEIAAELENDYEAPQSVKEFVGYLADHAFDSALQRKFIKNALDAGTHVSERQSTRKMLKKHFGPQYIDQISECTRAFFEITVWENRNFCLSLIKSKIQLEKKKTTHEKKQEEKAKFQTIIKQFFDYENNGSNGGHAHA